jgi:hypothetical protein
MRWVTLIVVIIAVAGCAGTQSNRLSRYEDQCASKGIPRGSSAMMNCVVEKDKAYQARQASDQVRESVRRMGQIEANSRVYR